MQKLLLLTTSVIFICFTALTGFVFYKEAEKRTYPNAQTVLLTLQAEGYDVEYEATDSKELAIISTKQTEASGAIICKVAASPSHEIESYYKIEALQKDHWQRALQDNVYCQLDSKEPADLQAIMKKFYS